MFLLENKLQSFYEEIKKLNEVKFKIKENEDNHKFFEKMELLNKNNSLNTNTYGMIEGETNVLSEKSNTCPIDSDKGENKKIEINKILIQNPNKSKIFNGKNENYDVNKKIDINNSPSETIVKCENDKRKHELNHGFKVENIEKESDFDLVIFSFFMNFLNI